MPIRNRLVVVKRLRPHVPCRYTDTDIWEAYVVYSNRGKQVRAKYLFLPMIEPCNVGQKLRVPVHLLKDVR